MFKVLRLLFNVVLYVWYSKIFKLIKVILFFKKDFSEFLVNFKIGEFR